MSSIDWSLLTRMPIKASLYRHDAHFRECLDEARDVLGARISETLRRSALMVVTPDGLVTAQLATICDYLAGHGFSIVAVKPFRFDRLMWRELWRFQLTRATLDHLAVNDLIFQAGPALLLLLRSEGDDDLPATVRLTSLKGKANPADRRPGTLRGALRHSTALYGMIHCADEPADLIRELGLLMDSATRRGLLRSLGSGVLDADHRELLDQQLKCFSDEGITLDSAASLQRIISAVQEAGVDETLSAHIGTVMSHLERMQRGCTIPWRRFAGELDRLPVEIDPWDLATLGTAFIVNYEPGESKMIENPDPETWRRGTSAASAA